jgi:hypothetical protein
VNSNPVGDSNTVGYTNTVALTVESITFFLSSIRQVPQMKTAVVKDSRKTDRAVLTKKRAGLALALFAGIAMPFAGCDSGSMIGVSSESLETRD